MGLGTWVRDHFFPKVQRTNEETPRNQTPSEDLFTSKGNILLTLNDIDGMRGRERYGPPVINGYIFLVALQVIVPLLILLIATWGQPTIFSGGLKDVKELIVALSASLSGVSGLAGFVIGHYFKK